MRFFLLFFLFITFSLQGQLIDKIQAELSKIQTLPEAHSYIRTSENLIGDILYLTAGYDTTALDVELLATNKGDLIDFDSEDKKAHYFYKTIDTKYVNSLRVQYIYLDNWRNTVNIDSIRPIILKRVSDGEPFDKLAQEYSMDVNAKKGGDRGWFEQGRMQPEVESNIKRRKLNEVYTVDIPMYRWYYIIKNTHLHRVDKKITVLWIEIKN